MSYAFRYVSEGQHSQRNCCLITVIDGANFTATIHAHERLTELIPDTSEFLRVDQARAVPDDDAKMDDDDEVQSQMSADEKEKARRKQLVDVMAIGVCNADPFVKENVGHSLTDHFKFHSL